MKYCVTLFLVCIAVLSDVSANSIPEFPFIAVDGTTEVEAAITTATIGATVLAHGKNAEVATEAVSSATRAILKELMELGVLEKSITAYDITKTPVRRSIEGSKELEILGYDVQRRITVELSSIASYVPVARVLLRADKVTSVTSQFGIEDEEALRQNAFIRACNLARQRADALAKATGTIVEKVHAVSDQGFSALEERFLLGGANAGVVRSGPPPLEEPLFTPEQMSFSCSVSVLFVIKQDKQADQ